MSDADQRLALAIRRDDPPAARALVASPADCLRRISLDVRGITLAAPAWHAASAAGAVGVMHFMLGLGVGVDSADDYGMTALHLAAIHARAESLALLLAVGANPRARAASAPDATALDYATERSPAGERVRAMLKAAGVRAGRHTYCVGTKEFDCGHRHASVRAINDCLDRLRAGDERDGVSLEYRVYRHEPGGGQESVRLPGVNL